jgi:hypothetical protein
VIADNGGLQHPIEPTERKKTFPQEDTKTGRVLSFGELSGFFGEKEVTLEILGADGFYWANPGGKPIWDPPFD